jgi:hypothetical protein
MCSLDARSGRPIQATLRERIRASLEGVIDCNLVVLLLAEQRRGMEPDDLLCSRNARPEKALVGRAQWKINQPPSLKRI